jgi:hypothetical protein
MAVAIERIERGNEKRTSQLVLIPTSQPNSHVKSDLQSLFLHSVRSFGSSSIY